MHMQVHPMLQVVPQIKTQKLTVALTQLKEMISQDTILFVFSGT